MAFNVGLALQIAGTVALFAVPFVGPVVGTALFVGGMAATMGGGMLAAQAAQPEPASRAARQVQTTSDPEAPWVTIYGEAVVGAHAPGAWVSPGGSQVYSGADYVLACHPCQELIAIQVGIWTFPITTNPAGNSNYNGRGLILNSDSLSDGFPTNWYVPVASSPWWRGAQDLQHEEDEGGTDRAHIGIRWSPGNRTATEPHMALRFGTPYSSRARKFTGHTVVSIITRANTELGTFGQIPEVRFWVRGKADIQTTGGTGGSYTTNPVRIFCDICREQLDMAVTDVISGVPGQNLSQLAAECDDTSWTGSGGVAKYEFNGVLRDDMPILDQLKLVCAHMAGGFSERGDRIVLYAGTVKTPWSRGPLTIDDVAGEGTQITTVPIDAARWANTYQPHRLILRAQDSEDQFELYGRMEPTARDVTSDTYISEDQGEELVQDRKYEACITGKQAKFLAWVELKQLRLGVGVFGRFKKRALVLEPGDVTALNIPELAPNGTLFQVTSKAFNPLTLEVDLAMVRYVAGIYIPDRTPTEDAIGRAQRNRSTLIPQVTGLAATTIDAHLQADGDIVCDVSVTWDLTDNLLVRAAGDIRIAWRKQTSTRWRSLTAAGDDTETVIPGLLQATPYFIRARAEGTPSAGRSDKPVSKWTTRIAFTPDSGIVTPGRPGTAILSHNEVHNPHFKQTKLVGGIKVPVGWEYESAASGSTVWDDTGGRHGSESTKITIVSHDRRIRPDFSELVAAEVGQRWRFRFWRRITQTEAPGTNTEILLNVQYYDANRSFVMSTTAGFRNTALGTHPYELVTGHHTVPKHALDIRFMRMQAAAKYVNGGYTVRFDAFQQKRVLGADGPVLLDIEEVIGTTWETLRSITVGTPGDEVTIQVTFDGRVGNAGSLVGNAQIRVRILRYDEDGTSNETTILSPTLVGNVISGSTSGYDQWSRRSLDAVDTTGVAGTYIYRAEFSTDNTGAKAAVRERRLTWRLAEQGTSS